MKSNGIVRPVDKLGRFVVPIEWRNQIGLEEKDQVEIRIQGNEIIVKRHVPGCHLCGDKESPLVEFYRDKHICKPCIEIIVKNEAKLKASAELKQ